MTTTTTAHGKHAFFWEDTASIDSTDAQLYPFNSEYSGVAANLGTSPIAVVGLPKAAAITQVLYLTEPGESGAVDAADIHQGALGDCFLLSSIGELALFHPTAISNMIHQNSNGTESVTLYTASNGRLPGFSTTAFKAVQVTVNNSTFSSTGVNSKYSYSQDIVGQQQEIWPQVLEQADATLNGGYGAIANGGYPVLAMEELTGQAAAAISPANLSWNALLSDISQGDLLVFETRNGTGLADGLVHNHAYMFASANTATQTVQLLNPWGFNNPAAIPFSKLAQAGIAAIDVGHVAASPTTSAAHLA